jgi:hypothetical protein
MTNKLFNAVDSLFKGENLQVINDNERGFVGKYLQSPGYLAALVNDDRSLNANPNELHVFFVNNNQVVVGQLLFNTDDIEVPHNLDKVNFIEGFISESADELVEWDTITVAYGTHYNSYDIESWVNDWFWSDHVLDVLDIKNDNWSSAMCNDKGCCPTEGISIKPLSYYKSESVANKLVEVDDDVFDAQSTDDMVVAINNILSKLQQEVN